MPLPTVVAFSFRGTFRRPMLLILLGLFAASTTTARDPLPTPFLNNTAITASKSARTPPGADPHRSAITVNGRNDHKTANLDDERKSRPDDPGIYSAQQGDIRWLKPGRPVERRITGA